MATQEIFELPPMGTDALGAEKVAVDHYVSSHFFEREKRHVFAKMWLMAGRESDVRKPGEFITFQIDAMSVSIAIVRAKDGVLHAFYNACTHRGARLLSKPCGKARGGLVCPLHGWAFGFDGNLLDVPGEDTFDDFSKETEGLRRVSVGVWGGFVFVNLDPNPAVDLPTYFAQLGPKFDTYLEDPTWRWTHGWSARVKANWKLVLDAQLEGYHVDQNHRKTVGPMVGSQNCRPYAFPASAGVPGGVCTFINADMNPTAFTPVFTIAGRFGGVWGNNPEGAADGGGVLRQHPLWLFDNYLLFPNVVMFIQRNRFVVQRVTPISVDETLWEQDVFDNREPGTFGELFKYHLERVQGRDALTEDLLTAEGVHANLKSGAITHISLSRQEVALRAFAQALHRAVGGVESHTLESVNG